MVHIVSEVHGTGADITTHGIGIHGLIHHGDITVGMTRSIFQAGMTHGIMDSEAGMTHGTADGLTTTTIADGTEDGTLTGDITMDRDTIQEVTDLSKDATDGMVLGPEQEAAALHLAQMQSAEAEAAPPGSEPQEWNHHHVQHQSQDVRDQTQGQPQESVPGRQA